MSNYIAKGNQHMSDYATVYKFKKKKKESKIFRLN